jgi:circadian clock protein KaiB
MWTAGCCIQQVSRLQKYFYVQYHTLSAGNDREREYSDFSEQFSSDMKGEKQVLTLYIAGQTQKAVRAIENIKRYCDEHLQEGYLLKVVDLKEHPELAASEQIIAVPTLIKELPAPIRIFGRRSF